MLQRSHEAFKLDAWYLPIGQRRQVTYFVAPSFHRNSPAEQLSPRLGNLVPRRAKRCHVPLVAASTLQLLRLPSISSTSCNCRFKTWSCNFEIFLRNDFHVGDAPISASMLSLPLDTPLLFNRVATFSISRGTVLSRNESMVVGAAVGTIVVGEGVGRSRVTFACASTAASAAVATKLLSHLSVPYVSMDQHMFLTVVLIFPAGHCWHELCPAST